MQVTGASDKTLRQWDLATGQCVMTMDILWAISHPQPSIPGNGLPNHLFPGAAASAGNFAVPTPPYADGSWEMYQDFVGGVQFWGYGLVSGSGDGAVRMWDSKSLWSPSAAPNVETCIPSADRAGSPNINGPYWSCNVSAVR